MHATDPMIRPTRRHVLTLVSAAALASLRAPVSPARAEEPIEAHGLSAFGDLAYPPDFHHFRYVDPRAPKGGTFSQIGPNRQFNQNFLTFNSLNSYILKGDAAQGMELTFATLMARSGDEPDAMYGLAAAKVRRSADGLTLRVLHAARSQIPRRHAAHRGTMSRSRSTSSRKKAIRSSPSRCAISSAPKPTATRASVVDLRAEARARRAAVRRRPADLLARLLRDEAVRRIDARRSARLGRLPGRPLRSRDATSNIERVKDWWGAELPVARGQNNFDIVRFEYYRDRDVGFEGFTAGQLSVPRGIHLAHLGDALRFSGHQGRPRQERHFARRHAVRRAGLVHQHAPRRNSPIRGCARRCATPSTSNGPTRRSCTAPTSAPSRCSRTRT